MRNDRYLLKASTTLSQIPVIEGENHISDRIFILLLKLFVLIRR